MHAFRSKPRPDADVIALLEQLLDSAHQGNVRSLVVVAANSIHQIDTASAGDLSEVRMTVLLGGLSRAAQELLSKRE